MLMCMLMFVLMRVVMRMVMPVRVQGFFLLPVDRYLHMGAGDAALDGLLGLHPNAGNLERVHFVKKSLPVGDQFQQGGHQHIARRAHGAFQIQGFQNGFLLSMGIVLV